MTAAKGANANAAAPNAPRFWDAMRLIAATAIGALVIFRATVFFAPTLVFDVDPAIDPTPIAGLGPPASMAIDALIWIMSALALLAETRSGRRVDLIMLLLALAGMPIVVWHGFHHLGNLWLGASWSAAIIAALTIAHLARDPKLRVLLMALTAAAIAAVLMRGLSQVLFEHARTVADYQAHRESFLAAQGWEPGSVQAEIYERRLKQNQPSGWFTTTNVLGSFAAASISLWGSLAVGLWRQFGWRSAAFLVLSVLVIVAVAGAELWLTTSKGALAAGALAAVIVLASHVMVRLRRRWQLQPASRKWLGGAGAAGVIALIALAVGAIVARGTLMPENALGDKSLLFRWYYMQGSLGMLADHGVLGTGPDRFQEIFLQHRPPRCPEEVTSAHNVLLDWVVTLGVAGWAWVSMLLIMAARAGARLLTESDAPASDATAAAGSSRIMLLAITTAVMLGLGGSAVVELGAVATPGLELWRAAGIIVALLVALLTLRAATMVSPATVSIALGGAATAMLVHAQVEMTMTQPASAALAMMMIALAAPAGAGTRRKIAIAISALLVLLAAWLVVRAVAPAWRQQQLMMDAARELAVLHERPARVPESVARSRAAEVLREAFEAYPSNPDPAFAAAQQLLAAASREDGERRAAHLREAMAHAELSIDTVSLPSYHALMANLNRALALTTGDESAWVDAAAHARELTNLDPNGLGAWKLYADIVMEWRGPASARSAYERVLAIDANMELDELKRLRDSERAEIERRVDEGAATDDQP